MSATRFPEKAASSLVSSTSSSSFDNLFDKEVAEAKIAAVFQNGILVPPLSGGGQRQIFI